MGAEDPEMAHIGPDSIPPQSSNSLLANTRCCFCFPCFGSRRSSSVRLAWWERVRSSRGHSDDDNPWWAPGVRAIKKIREWSEIVAGPRWKTFIRRFNRNRGSGNSRHGKFQYDPLSYALNFDEGPGQNSNFDEEDDYGGFRDFSSRYASVSGSGKPLAMDASSNKDVALIAVAWGEKQRKNAKVQDAPWFLACAEMRWITAVVLTWWRNVAAVILQQSILYEFCLVE